MLAPARPEAAAQGPASEEMLDRQRRERRRPGRGVVPLVGARRTEAEAIDRECSCKALGRHIALDAVDLQIVVQRTAVRHRRAVVGRVAGAVNRVAVKLVVSAGARLPSLVTP